MGGYSLLIWDASILRFAQARKALIKNRWGLVVAGSTIQHRKRIRLFDKVLMKTHIAGFDERWVYIEQSMGEG